MSGSIPALFIQARTLPEAWEKAVLACWQQGVAIKTEYDKPGDPASRDCTMMWVCEEPFSERASIALFLAAWRIWRSIARRW